MVNGEPERAANWITHATGYLQPYPWQVRLAVEGLPETLEIPTGCGKTAGVVLGWLYRRRFHSDAQVRLGTPRRLVFTLPLRTLVEQTRSNVMAWLGRLGLTDGAGDGQVLVRTLLGGERGDDAWRIYLERDAILIGTLDMILSRALNRGYGSNRYLWPVDFGLLNNDCHFVFDEVQLMGAAVPTSRQLDAFRRSVGVSGPMGSTWMSATLDRGRLVTVDAPEVAAPFSLDDSDRDDELVRRLEAGRTVERWVDEEGSSSDPSAARAAAVLSAHRPGTLTLVVVNTVAVARELYKDLVKAGLSAPIVLLHSRFRPPDRAVVLERALAPPGKAGTIVVSTQVVEAGVDLSATTLFTEVAPWSSIVQRAGRCNRDGRVEGAQLRWDSAVKDLPYLHDDLSAARQQLELLSGRTVSTIDLAGIEVTEGGIEDSVVLRRADLVRLFDTTPDLTGNDLDVSPFIRDGDDLDVQVCWRRLGDGVDAEPSPSRDELCPVPLGELREWLARTKRSDHRAYRLDYLDRRRHRWLPADIGSLRPGQVLLLDSRSGGYEADIGWSPRLSGPVPPLGADRSEDPAPLDEAIGDDPASYTRRWVSLSQHLCDVERVAGEILAELALESIPTVHREAVTVAARWHDLGKAHEVFQQTMAATRGESDPDPGTGPWAKSGGSKRTRHERRFFRHELASALALLGDAGPVLDTVAERALVIYLVAAHHGRVRLAIRSFPGEDLPPVSEGETVRRFALGVWDGDQIPAVAAGEFVAPGADVGLWPMELGGAEGRPSWTAMATELRDRQDLGPFRLAYLEAIVRMADWRASASYDHSGDRP